MLIAAVLAVSSPASVSAAGYGGPGVDRVAVCRATSSQFRPFVLVTVPQFVADRYLAQGGVKPDSAGKCPEGINIRDYIAERIEERLKAVNERIANIRDRFARR